MLSPDFKESVQLLNSHKVRYLVIGGYAVAYNGHPRYTKDIDVWLDVSNANAGRMMAVLRDFGFDSVGLTAEDFAKADQVIQLGYPPVRIDMLVGIRSLSFRSCYARRITAQIDGINVNFIDLDGLLESKRIAGRAQDLADIEQLTRPLSDHASDEHEDVD